VWTRQRRGWIPALVLVGLAGGRLAGCSAGRPAQPPTDAVLAIWRAGIDSLARDLETFQGTIQRLDDPAAVSEARSAFIRMRATYKTVEVALEYYAPSTARAMNGPPLPEVEEDDGPEAIRAPTGFQVIEEPLFGEHPADERQSLAAETAVVAQLVARAQTMFAAQQTTDAHIFDAVQLELARLMTLGLAGFDTPIVGTALPEAAQALEGILRTLEPYRRPDASWRDFETRLRSVSTRLRETGTRDAADHFALLADGLIPLARNLRALRVAHGVTLPPDRRPFHREAASLFDSGAIDVEAFGPPSTAPASPEVVALGASLFADSRLSRNRDRSCSSCHVAALAFTDGRSHSVGRDGRPLPRNTPTVLNSGVQVGSFADLRTTYLEDQVTDVIGNPDEMHGSLDAVVRALTEDRAIVERFASAFRGRASGSPGTGPSTADRVVTGPRLRAALAAYMRHLTRLDSRVDQALRGQTDRLSPIERQGFNVFVGKGRCASCHFLPLTNGTVPPLYQRSEVEIIGVPTSPVTRRATLDPDPGRFRITRALPHRFAFRTPTLRNAALTAPYMHNGAYPTLESVVDFYNRGGGLGIGARVDGQTLPADTLGLTSGEQTALVAFLGALTDTTGLMPRRTARTGGR